VRVGAVTEDQTDVTEELSLVTEGVSAVTEAELMGVKKELE